MTRLLLANGTRILALVAAVTFGGTFSAWAASGGNKSEMGHSCKHHDHGDHHGGGRHHDHGKRGAQSEERFNMIDANGDGSISMEELQSATQAPFAEADADGDGSISREEMRSYLMDQQARRVEKMLDRLISQWDENGDGAVSAEEFGGKRNPGRMFERLDSDGDGSISMEEFTR